MASYDGLFDNIMKQFSEHLAFAFVGPLTCLEWNPRVMMLYRFAGDTAELGVIRAGTLMKAKVVLNPRVHLVCDMS